MTEPAIRLSQIDASNRWAHTRLSEDDLCYYLFEYAAGTGYHASRTNRLIRDLKRKPSEAARPGYHFKGRAIDRCAEAFRGALDSDWLKIATFVPVPGSKDERHPDYDDRMDRICRGLGCEVDVRALVRQSVTTAAAHESDRGERIAVDSLVKLYRFDQSLIEPAPKALVIVDDVLTSGTHFRAMVHKLDQRWPEVPKIGLFVARRILPAAKGGETKPAGARVMEPKPSLLRAGRRAR